MLQLSLIEFILRTIPESMVLILGTHIFSGTKISRKTFLQEGLLLATMVYIIRSLPISYGIHTVLGIMANLIIVRILSNIEMVQAIQSVIITVLIQFGAELINTLWIQFILRKDLEVIFSDPTAKLWYGLPSLLICGLIIICYRRWRRKEGIKEWG